MPDINDTIAERASRYGEYSHQAKLANLLQGTMRSFMLPHEDNHGGTWPFNCLDDTKRHALNMISEKIARILTGDPDYADNWHDIGGYAKLVEDRLPGAAHAAIATKGLKTLEEALKAETGLFGSGAMFSSANVQTANGNQATASLKRTKDDLVREGRRFYPDFDIVALDPNLRINEAEAQAYIDDPAGGHKLYAKGLRARFEIDHNQYERWVLDHDRDATKARNEAREANDKIRELVQSIDKQGYLVSQLRVELESAYKELKGSENALQSYKDMFIRTQKAHAQAAFDDRNKIAALEKEINHLRARDEAWAKRFTDLAALTPPKPVWMGVDLATGPDQTAMVYRDKTGKMQPLPIKLDAQAKSPLWRQGAHDATWNRSRAVCDTYHEQKEYDRGYDSVAQADING